MRHRWKQGINTSTCRRCGILGKEKLIRRGGYLRCPGIPVDVLDTILLCIDIEVPKDVISEWDEKERDEVMNWAGKVHLQASDNNVMIPAVPHFLDLASYKKRTCRICGCTDDRACPGGCHWVEKDLCSACKPAVRYKNEPKKSC
jgi:hypothetical protein